MLRKIAKSVEEKALQLWTMQLAVASNIIMSFRRRATTSNISVSSRTPTNFSNSRKSSSECSSSLFLRHCRIGRICRFRVSLLYLEDILFCSREVQTERHHVERTGGWTLNLRTTLASPKKFLSGCFSGGLVSWSRAFRNVLLEQAVLARLFTLCQSQLLSVLATSQFSFDQKYSERMLIVSWIVSRRRRFISSSSLPHSFWNAHREFCHSHFPRLL